MLRLTLQGKVIPVSRDFTMRLTWKSPATNFEMIPGGYAFGMSFPINEHTRALFGNPERFSKYRAGNDQKFPGFEARFSGVLLMAGTLSVTASKGQYDASLTDEIGVLGEKEQERDILTFPAFTKDIAWVNLANYEPVNPYCCFPVVNMSFFKEKGITITVPERSTRLPDDVNGDEVYQVVPEYETEALSYGFAKLPVMSRVNSLDVDNTIRCIATQFEVTNTATVPAISVVSPFFFLQYIITEALKSVGWHIDKNAFSTSDILKNLCVYNNFDFTKNESIVVEADKLTTETTTAVGMDGEDEELAVFVVQGYRISQYKRSYPPTLKAKDHLPKMKLGTLLLSTQNLLNLCFHFLPDNRVNIFLRDQLLNGEAMDLDAYFLDSWAIGEKKDLALNFKHEQDKNDLIFSERFHDIEDRIQDLKAPVADWDALMAITDAKEGDIRWMASSNSYLEYKLITIEEEVNETLTVKKDILGWEEYSIGFQNGWYQKGKPEVEEINTEWSTCYGNTAFTVVSQPGNMNTWRAAEQAFSPRLLIYKGNNAGGNERDDFSLDYEKPGKGIIPTFWKYWAPFWANRLPVAGTFDLPVNVLSHLIYNICNKYRTREGEFMIEEMSCDIYIDRIGETEIRGFKVE